jgi:nickel-dependent lactate racemase
MKGVMSHEEAKRKFDDLGFTVGPHKSYQFALLSEKVNFEIKSEIDQSTLKELLIQPVSDLQKRIDQIVGSLSEDANIAIIPFATATIPNIVRG